jgi:hypothetical protein
MTNGLLFSVYTAAGQLVCIAPETTLHRLFGLDVQTLELQAMSGNDFNHYDEQLGQLTIRLINAGVQT